MLAPLFFVDRATSLDWFRRLWMETQRPCNKPVEMLVINIVRDVGIIGGQIFGAGGHGTYRHAGGSAIAETSRRRKRLVERPFHAAVARPEEPQL